jgi:flavin reductase (DIM6/NTAB) family NADH-FMN oxidoreductase RutF
MDRTDIPLTELILPPFGRWEPGWLLLTAGELKPGRHDTFNSMTVSWGGLGEIWSRPLALVVVRPQRHTYQFMENSATFSLCAFPEALRSALRLLGTKSGRDGDKIAEAGLTPIDLTHIAAPGFAEAELILECRKSYYQDLDPRNFLADYIAPCYRGDYHRMYFGEVLGAQGTGRYRGGK